MLTAAFLSACSGAVAILLSRSWFPQSPAWMRAAVGATLFQTALLAPVYVAATLQVLGVTDRVEFVQIIGFAVVLLGATFAYSRRSRPSTNSRPEGERETVPLYLKYCGVVLAATYAIGWLNVLTSYVRDYDAVSYHLLLPLHWLLDGTFEISTATHWRLAMPANAEAAAYVFMAGGSERLIPLAQLAPLVALASSVYGLARHLTQDRIAALLCLATTLTAPIIYYQTFSAYVDLFAVGFMLAALLLGLHAKADRTSGFAYALCAGLACGLAIGTKSLYLVYGAAFVATLCTTELWDGRSFAALVKRVWPVCAGIVLTGGFWMARGLLLTGNPIFPLQLSLGDWVLFDGVPANAMNPPGWAIGRWVSSEIGWLTYPWIEFKRRAGATGYGIDSGVGGVFAAFIPLAAAYLISIAWRTRSRQLWALLGAIGFCALVWWFPSHQTLRFGAMLGALLVVAAAPFYSLLARSGGRLFRGAFCAALTVTCAVLALEPLALFVGNNYYGEWSRAGICYYPRAVDRLPAGATVLNLFGGMNFSMAGDELNHRVVARFEAPATITAEFLEQRGIDYIAGSAAQAHRVEGTPGVQEIAREEVQNQLGQRVQSWIIWEYRPGAP